MIHVVKRLRFLAAALLLALAAAGPLPALTVKIGTLAPEGSPWVDGLRQIAAEWARRSQGSVQLRIYAGGIVGEEADMRRKLRIGQLQAAALTQLGLGLLEPDLLPVSSPFLVRDERELDRVLEATRPYYAGQFQAKGYRLLVLAKAGWVHFFAREAIVVPADLKRLRLAVPDGDDELVGAWRRLGFNAFSLSINDLLTGLQAGLADACYAPLLAAASFQWFGSARYMPSLAVAPVLGGVLLSERTAASLPPDLLPPLLDCFHSLEEDLNRRMSALETEALQGMRRHGRSVIPVPPEAAAQWHELGARGSRLMIGSSLSQASYDRILAVLEDSRR